MNTTNYMVNIVRLNQLFLGGGGAIYLLLLLTYTNEIQIVYIAMITKAFLFHFHAFYESLVLCAIHITQSITNLCLSIFS